MPPRKSTSSVTPADADDSMAQHSSPPPQSDKPVYATEQQLKARAEAGASIEVSRISVIGAVSGTHWEYSGHAPLHAALDLVFR